MKRFLIVILAVMAALAVIAGCAPAAQAPAQTEQTNADTAPADSLSLTLEELAEFNGQDGNPAYIAVDGVLYDVSDVAPWSTGAHQGFSSGADVSEQIKDISPHGLRVLDNLPVVGQLVD